MTSYLYPYIQESASLDSKLLSNYILTIQYYLDGLSFVIFDPSEQKFLCLKHYKTNEKNNTFEALMTELQEIESWSFSDFRKVNIIVDDNRNTFIPHEFSDEKMNDCYMSIMNITEKNNKSDIINSGIDNVYPISESIHEFLSNHKEINLYHSSSILIKSIFKEFSERIQETRAFVNVKNNSYELTIVDNGNLLFHNYFNFTTKEDFIYFILFSFEQVKIDNETTPLYFMGLIEEKSVLVELCSRYIRNIRFFKRNNDFNYTNELDSIPYYYYYILFSSVSCE